MPNLSISDLEAGKTFGLGILLDEGVDRMIEPKAMPVFEGDDGLG